MATPAVPRLGADLRSLANGAVASTGHRCGGASSPHSFTMREDNMRTCRMAVMAALAGLAMASPAWGADHRDGPGVRADISADINDVFAWMSADAARVYLVMTVFPFAPAEARFADSVQYVFHTSSASAFGQP